MAEPLSLCDERLKAVLSYPHFKERHYRRVLGGLRRLGVEGIEPKGASEVCGVKVLGKGCVGVVVAGLRGGGRVAVKVLRTDANRASLKGEAASLRVANSEGVGPPLIGQDGPVLVMGYIEGTFLSQWLREPHPEGRVASVLMTLLAQCRRLDRAGLDHGELSEAKKHIIVDRQGVPHIIDFETASQNRTCRNLTSMVNYLFFKDSMSALTSGFLRPGKEELRGALRAYRKERSDGAYRSLMCLLGFPATE